MKSLVTTIISLIVITFSHADEKKLSIEQKSEEPVIAFNAIRLAKKDVSRISLRYLKEKDGKSYLYIEPGCFRSEAQISKVGKDLYKVSITPECIIYASYLLKLMDTKFEYLLVKVNSENKILELNPIAMKPTKMQNKSQ